MLKRVIFLPFIASAAFAGANNICFEYPNSSYILENSKIVQQKNPATGKIDYKDKVTVLDSKKYRLILAVKKKPTKLHNHSIFLVKKKSGEILDFTSFSCPDSSPNPKRFYCYGECDSGIISFEKRGEINFKTGGITVGDSPDAPEGTWRIKPKYEADLPAPVAIECPKRIASMNIAPNGDDKEYIKHEIKYLVKPMKYVCYKSKNISKSSGKTVYHGCRYTRSKCDDYYPGWKEFGHYPNEKAALKAYERCKFGDKH